MSILHPLGPDGQIRRIKEGDLVIVYERFDSMKAVTITPDGRYHNKFGQFDMKDWIDQPFGGRVVSKAGKGWVILLAPTAELWTLVLRHRTQILYLADISTICFRLELRPGSIVLESGTGSGSLTTSLARGVAPTGKVYTFEFHELRAKTSAEEFKSNGLSDYIVVEQRNIEEQGFPETLHSLADAVFLDLPGPWKAIPSAARCLRPDGVFCGFSPCIEQVQKTCEALNAHGFKDLETVEILLKEIDITLEKELGGKDVLESLLQEQVKKEAFEMDRRRRKNSNNDDSGKEKEGALDTTMVEKEEEEDDDSNNNTNDDNNDNEQSEKKRAKIINGNGGAENVDDRPREETEATKPTTTTTLMEDQLGVRIVPTEGAVPSRRNENEHQDASLKKVTVARPVSQGRGHTGYLTFARKAVSGEQQ